MDKSSFADYSNSLTVQTNIELKINGVSYQVPNNIHPKTTLNYFIRNFAKLTGTKYMCLEGGCGACIVSVTKNNQTFSVNSCLVVIFLCHGWNVTTIEAIGDKTRGYDNLQTTLANENGSQCGYCSPAMIMNMHSLIESGKNIAVNIENSFGGNICRCTGYRSILDSFQKFATNQASGSLVSLDDIEDLHKTVIFPKNCKLCKNAYKDFVSVDVEELEPICLKLDGANFFKVFNLNQVFEIFRKYPYDSYILNGGNTGNGVYRIGEKDLYIDIKDIHELHRAEKTNTSITLGSGISLEIAKDIFYQESNGAGFGYLRQLGDHVDRIGHLSMRNIGTIAGNLMLKHDHPDFPSDLFLILETVNASLQILEREDSIRTMSLLEFLQLDMQHKLIYSVTLPRLTADYTFMSYKIMPVAQNAHAIVNAGFLFRLDSRSNVIERPNIIFGGINPDFHHAWNTELFLTGKPLFDKNILQKALDILDTELNPDYALPDPKPEFRKLLAEGLFYKFILSLQPWRIPFKLRSGGSTLQRPLSSGVASYETNKTLWPDNEPLTKIEALYQVSGEAEYVNDIPTLSKEVFCVLTLSTRIGKIKGIDYDAAMQISGVLAFYSAKDVPKNIFINSKKGEITIVSDEPLFAENEVSYVGQPFGVIAAISEYKALDAAKKVRLIYADESDVKPILTIEDVLASNDVNRIKKTFDQSATKPPGNDVKYKISGNVINGSEYHYTMEPQTCLCIPIEDGLNIFAATQWAEMAQFNVASCLGISQNSINVSVKRLGGGYGGKQARTCQMICACAVVAYKTNRPARSVMSIEDMMMSIGKRGASLLHYDIGVNGSGKIQYSNLQRFSNEGYTFNDIHPSGAQDGLQNCYDFSTWNLTGYNLLTDLPSNTFMRGPGSFNSVSMIETVMDHIAQVTGRDPVQVRLENLNDTDKKAMQSLISEIMKTSEYDSRRKTIESFNTFNRWKKKGISFVAMKFPISFLGAFNALVSIYARDGTVAITHAGIEIGQGINTKVVQVAAYTLGIDVSMIKIKPSTTLTSPNSTVTANSMTSDSCASATISACKELLERLKPIREKMKNPTWPELVYEAYNQGIDLCAVHQYFPKPDVIPQPYAVYGATVAEVEIDVLTGEHIVHRVDILEDTGISLNPKIDMGQVQGAFIMGLGHHTCEELIYDPKTGALTNFRTWNYKVPGAKDIPVDFRVSFLRNAPNSNGVLRSKATGEPAICMGVAIPLAIRKALNSARCDAGNSEVWYEMENPATVERILLSSLTNKRNMTL